MNDVASLVFAGPAPAVAEDRTVVEPAPVAFPVEAAVPGWAGLMLLAVRSGFRAAIATFPAGRHGRPSRTRACWFENR